MRKYYVIGYHAGKSRHKGESALCIIDANNAISAMDKAMAHYGTGRVVKCMELGSAEAVSWWRARETA